MENELKLNSKHVNSLQEILLIIDCLTANKKSKPEDIEKIIAFFSIESDFLLEEKEKEQEKENELIASFENFHDTLVKLIGKDKSFNSIISQIFKNK